MTRTLILLILAPLCACTTVPEKQILTRAETIRVTVPVPVACVKREQIPPMPKTSCSATLTLEQKVRCLDIDLHESQDYAVRAAALLEGCAEIGKDANGH